MRTLAAAFAVLALASSAQAAPRVFDETERVTRTIPMEPGGTLRLNNFSGRVTITASDRPEVVIDATRRGTRSQLDRIQLDIHTSGANLVVIDANQRDRSWWRFASGSNVVETEFDIKVPRRTRLDLTLFSSPLTVTGVEGAHKLHGFSSPIVLNDVTGSVQAQTFSGRIELHVPDEARGTVTFNSFSGRLDSEIPLTMHSSSRRSLRAELGGGGDGTLRFKTFSGSVKIDR